MELTIPGAVASAAREFGDAPALADTALADPWPGPDGPRISYRELDERVTAVAAALIAEGVAPADRVAIWAPNTYHWVLAALGALSAGATLVPVSTRFTGPEALDVISRSGARALFVAGDFLGVDRLAALRAAAAEAARADGGAARADGGAASADGGADGSADGGGLDRLGLVVRVPGDWAAFVGRAAAVPPASVRERAAAVRPDDVSDIMFTSGTTGRSKGAMTSHERSLAVARAWADCGRLTPADRYLAVNPFFHTFGFKAGLLACLVSGATLVPQAVFDAGQAMRLTEAVVATMCRPGDAAETVARTSGRAAAGFEVRIADDGEILLRGPNLMLGYLDDPEATKAALDADGWLHTGDAGRLEGAGYLAITGRIKDMYICGGFNVYPAEVEQVLARLDGVAESAVVGVPDPRLGEVGQAFIIRRPGHVLEAADVLAFCRERLANYKVPRRVEFRDALPRNPSGKVLKRLLRSLGGTPPQTPPILGGPIPPDPPWGGQVPPNHPCWRNRDGGRGLLRPAWPHRPDHAEPAEVRQRPELRDDLRAGRGLRPRGERRPGRGARAGRCGRSLLRRPRHRHPGTGRGQVLRPPGGAVVGPRWQGRRGRQVRP